MAGAYIGHAGVMNYIKKFCLEIYTWKLRCRKHDRIY